MASTVSRNESDMSSRRMDPNQLSLLIRDPWSAMKNDVHYSRDVNFQEDKSKERNRGGAEMVATFRNLAMTLYVLKLKR